MHGSEQSFRNAHQPGVRNAMLWRVPGQRQASMGINNRFVESIDIFPTLIALTGQPTIPKCNGIDQPPTTRCLQGESYATEFIAGAVADGTSALQLTPKQYAFSQWPYPKWGNETGLREGYTIRSTSGYRYTTYVPYDISTFTGDWAAPLGDEELYDYNIDRWETTSYAEHADYANIKSELRAALLKQYTGK